MTKLKEYRSDKVRKCRLCGESIDKDRMSFMFEDLNVGNKNVNVHFHPDCLIEACQGLRNWI